MTDRNANFANPPHWQQPQGGAPNRGNIPNQHPPQLTSHLDHYPGYGSPAYDARQAPQRLKKKKSYPWVLAGTGLIAIMIIIAAVNGGGGGTTASTAGNSSSAPAPTSTWTAPQSYEKISVRDFKLLAKDPDSFIGKGYIIYGEVTQFDSATGNDHFRANTGPEMKEVTYGFADYDQNSVLSGDPATLTEVVEGDLFEAKVIGAGSYSYDTQIGGNTTVPQFRVAEISVYGNTDE